MRPFVVLTLVVAAAAALVFAVISGDSGPGRDRPNSALTPELDPADSPPDRPAASLAEVPATREAAPARTARVEAPDLETGGEATGSYPNEVKGIVTDPDGNPLESAKVVLTQDALGGNGALRLMMGSRKPKGPRYERVTNASGAFSFRGVQPATGYTLIGRHEKFSTVEVPYIDVPPEGVIEEGIQLEVGYLVHGVVRDQASRPVVGAEITLDSVPFYAGAMDHPDVERRTTTTDERGAYGVENVTPGNRTLSVSAKSFGSQTKANLLVQGEDRTIEHDFRLEPGALIAGRIFGPDNTGIEGATIEAIMYTKEITSRGRAISRKDGEFVIEDISPGELYQIIARADGWGEQRLNRISAGETNLQVEMAEQGGVQGRVVDARTGKPITNFRCAVRFVNTANNMYARTAVEQTFEGAKDGRFSISGIEQNTYAIQCYANGYAPTFSDNFSVSQGLLTPDIEVRMSQGGGIVGVVRDSAGNPIKGAQIKTNENKWVDSQFIRILGGMMPRTTTPKTVRSDDSGRFKIEMVTPGMYQIEISHADHTTTVLNDVNVQDGPPHELAPVTLRIGATIRGTVFDAAGDVVRGAQVQVTNEDQPGGNRQVRTDAQGRYEVRNVAGGRYKISAMRTPAQGTGNAFHGIIDMKNSEVQTVLTEGGEFNQDLHFGD